jgi:hypothetical protein
MQPLLTTQKPLARWTIGPVQPDGFRCLEESIHSFTKFYDLDVVVCFNCNPNNLAALVGKFPLIDQSKYINSCPVQPKGVAWKLYPPRLTVDRHELIIDNDIILSEKVPQIDEFLGSNSTLLLEEASRTYGRFEKFVPPKLCINSGIYGMPPYFDLQKYVDFYATDEWQKNALGEHDKSETFDEQGLIAFALSSHPNKIMIPATVIINCEHQLNSSKGMHFIGLNRRKFHFPFRLYKYSKTKQYL